MEDFINNIFRHITFFMGIFSIFDLFLSGKNKKIILQTLRGEGSLTKNIPQAVQSTRLSFLSIFGDKFFSSRSILSSLALSIFWLVAISLFFYSQSYTQFNELFSQAVNSPTIFYGIIGTSIIASIFTDYISIHQSLFILKKASNISSFKELVLYLLIDLLLTAIIFVVIFPFFWLLLNIILPFFMLPSDEIDLELAVSLFKGNLLATPSLLMSSIDSTFSNVIEFSKDFMIHGDYMYKTLIEGENYKVVVPFTSWFYSSFMTSFILWSYLFVVFLAKLITKINHFANLKIVSISLSSAPFTAIGFYIGVLVTVIDMLLRVYNKV